MTTTSPMDTDITMLVAGTQVLGTDVYPAVDVTDLTQAPTGSTKKYTITQLAAYLQMVVVELPLIIVTALSEQMTGNTRYITNNVGQVSLTLPTTFAINQIIEIGNMNGGFIIHQNALQNIIFGNLVTATGIGGSISSTALGDGVRLVSVVANTTFFVLPGTQGNLIAI